MDTSFIEGALFVARYLSEILLFIIGLFLSIPLMGFIVKLITSIPIIRRVMRLLKLDRIGVDEEERKERVNEYRRNYRAKKSSKEVA